MTECKSLLRIYTSVPYEIQICYDLLPAARAGTCDVLRKVTTSREVGQGSTCRGTWPADTCLDTTTHPLVLILMSSSIKLLKKNWSSQKKNSHRDAPKKKNKKNKTKGPESCLKGGGYTWSRLRWNYEWKSHNKITVLWYDILKY